MPSERLPTSTPPDTSPTEVVIDTHESREHVTDQSDTSGSFLHDGGALLAESLGKLASENDPAAIRDYLKDILADTEGNVPAAERAAAFTLLAEQQKQTMRQEVLHVGDQMDTTLEKTNANFTASVANSSRTLRNALGAFSENANVMARGRITPATKETSLNAARSMQQKLEEITESQTTWAGTQRAALNDFRGALTSTITSEARLRKTGESLSEDYDGEPIDASTVIRGDVLTQFATKLHSELTAEGTNPTEVIAQLLNAPEDEATLETIHHFKNYVDEYDASLEKILGDHQTNLAEPTEMLRRYRRDEATKRLGGSAGREQATIATLQNSPRKIAKNADTLNSKQQEMRRRVQAARGNKAPKPATSESAPVRPEATTLTPAETTAPVAPVEFQAAEAVAESAPEPIAEAASEGVQETPTEIIEPVEITPADEPIEEQPTEQDAVTEPISTTTEELPVAEPEIIATSEETTEEIIAEVPEVIETIPEETVAVEQPPLTYEQPNYSSANGTKEYIGPEPIEPVAPKVSRIDAADKAIMDGIYSLKNLPPEPVGKTKPKVEPKVAESPYGAGYTQSAPRQQSPAERQFSAPGAEAAQTEYVKIKRPAHIRREAAQNQGQPEPRIYRPDDNRSEQKSEPLYNVTHHDVNEMRNIIARQAAEAAKRHPNQTPTWIQMINNPVSSPRKSREERFYESRTGRFLINVGSLAVRAGKFLRRK